MGSVLVLLGLYSIYFSSESVELVQLKPSKNVYWLHDILHALHVSNVDQNPFCLPSETVGTKFN